MKNTFILLFFFILALSADAQPIQLKDSGLVLVGRDTSAIVGSLQLLNAALLPAQNAKWDLAGLRYTRQSFCERLAPATDPVSPRTDFIYKGSHPLDVNLFQLNRHFESDSTGIGEFALRNAQRQTFSRRPTSGTVGDSFIIPVQIIPLSAPIKPLQFPASMDSMWHSNATCTTACFIYSKVGSLVNVPVNLVSSYTVDDSIVGWGVMRVGLMDTNKVSEYVPVLQVFERYRLIDSFMSGGVPVPDSVLTYLGLTQGITYNNYVVKFLRMGEVEPLLAISTGTATFSYVDGATATLMRLRPTAAGGIGDQVRLSLSIYPNPAKEGRLHINCLKPAWLDGASYSLLAFSGQLISSGHLSQEHTVELPDHLAPGIYVLRMIGKDGLVAAVPIQVE